MGAAKMTENEKKAYKAGMIDGFKTFAHWRNGEQEVGTTGTTLKDAIENVTGCWNYSPRIEKE